MWYQTNICMSQLVTVPLVTGRRGFLKSCHQADVYLLKKVIFNRDECQRPRCIEKRASHETGQQTADRRIIIASGKPIRPRIRYGHSLYGDPAAAAVNRTIPGLGLCWQKPD